MHPVVFTIPKPWGDGELPIHSYGVMLGTSLIIAWYAVMHLGVKHENMKREVMGNLFIVTAVFALVCSRILYILTNLNDFPTAGSWLEFQSGGYVAYGGFLGGLLGSWLYVRYKKLSLLAWTDVAAPTLGIGLALTRIGCYLYGCDFGRPLSDDAPQFLRDWGTFPRHATGGGSPAWDHHVRNYDLSPLSDYSLPVHPTQLYESAVGVILFGVAMLLWRRRKFRGQVILAITILYGAWRFLIEYVRDDPERGFYFGFSTSQLISMVLVPLMAFIYYTLRRKQGDAPLVAARAIEGSDVEEGEAPAKKKTKAKTKRRKKRKNR